MSKCSCRRRRYGDTKCQCVENLRLTVIKDVNPCNTGSATLAVHVIYHRCRIRIPSFTFMPNSTLGLGPTYSSLDGELWKVFIKYSSFTYRFARTIQHTSRAFSLRPQHVHSFTPWLDCEFPACQYQRAIGSLGSCRLKLVDCGNGRFKPGWLSSSRCPVSSVECQRASAKSVSVP